MSGKPPSRSERRAIERAARQLVRDREKLAALEVGGSQARPIAITTSAVVDTRIRATPCPLCAGELLLREHAAPAPGIRRADVVCRQCHAPRSVWFRIAPAEPN